MDHAFAESVSADDLRALTCEPEITDRLARRQLAADARELVDHIEEDVSSRANGAGEAHFATAKRREEVRNEIADPGVNAEMTPNELVESEAADILARLSEVASSLGATRALDEAVALRERSDNDRFYVACVGQFKRGKSTLLNALIGAHVLPTGVIPVTSVPTIIRYGSALAARVRLATTARNVWMDFDPAFLREFVSEEGNPENAKGVLAIELFAPSALLETGMCLVDTPGLGSIFTGNTSATREFVPHIDAALVVLGADPPISGEELALVEEISRHSEHLFFVLNKADRVSDAEREEARAFTTRVLAARLGERRSKIAGGKVFSVSALERLEGRGSRRDWDALTTSLCELCASSGHTIARKSVARGIARLRAGLLIMVEEGSAALSRPFEESEARLTRLARHIEKAERALSDLGPLFGAEQSRLARVFSDRRTRFLREAGAAASLALRERLAGHGITRTRGRTHAFAVAQQVARDIIEPFLAESEIIAHQAFADAATRFVSAANNFLRHVRDTDGDAMMIADELPGQLVDGEQLRGRRRFYFHEYQRLAAPSGLGPAMEQVLDALGPRRFVARRIERAAQAFLAQLLETNASRVEGDVTTRVIESRRDLEAAIRRAMSEAMEIVTTSLARSRTLHAEGEASVAAAFARLQFLRSELNR